ncbi:GerAB/ArcD/ProY family transporter [Shimazuella kribbensis]|uniref:GerAB/ArcD/ProY family transporter n=1 Tax=Shimazuella kribbensis TaxID=139808 RepID=UPI000404F5D0|nr:GerAB/ArcD/ProY family transporter [Shimazuella kribbensis]
MTKQKDFITTSQTIVAISSHMTSLGILTLPRAITEVIKTPDGWLSILLAGLLLIGFSIILVKLCQRFPQQTVFEFSQVILGKWLGQSLSYVLIIYFILLTGFEIRGMAEVTKLYLLPRTPFIATIVPFICLGLYLIISGINSIVRLFEILLPPTIIVFLLVSLLSLKTFELNNIRPVLGLGIWPVIKGLNSTSLSLTGIESLLVLSSFMREPRKAIKAATIGISIPLSFYVIIFIFTVGSLGVAGVTTKTWPVISLFRQFELTGIVFERFESFMIAVWILQIFTTFVSGYYMASLGFAQLTHKKMNPFIFGLAPIMYLTAMAPRNINDVFHFGNFLGYCGVTIIVAVSSILLIIAIVRRKKHVPVS